MIILFVDETANCGCKKGIERTQEVESQGRNSPLQNHDTEILDVAVHGITQKQTLNSVRKGLHLVKNRRQIHQQHGKHIIQIGDVLEEDEQSRKDQSHADVKNNQAADRIEQGQEMDADRHFIQQYKQEEHAERQPKVDQRRYVLGHQEHIFRHIDLCKDGGIRHKRVHPPGRCLPVVGEDQIAAEQIDRVMWSISSKKLGEDQAHYQQIQKR